MSPNVNVVPPRIGPSSRYQTSSIMKNTNPVPAAIVETSQTGVWGNAGGSSAATNSGGGAVPRATRNATTATARLTAQAIQSVVRVPVASIRMNVAITAPATPPRVFTP